MLVSAGKLDIPSLEIEEETFNRLFESYSSAIKETKNVIHSEINTKVKKSIELKRGFKPKRPKLK